MNKHKDLQATTAAPKTVGSTTSSRSALIVTGMHRTGSSAMTRVLALAGARLPNRLLDASEGNPTGHWEPLEVMRLNDRLLGALGSDWCDPLSHRLRGGAGVSDPDWFELAQAVLAEDYAGAPLIVLKDPRTSLLMNFWRRALSLSGWSPRTIVMVRDPLEVAQSLERRNQFPFSQSVLLWTTYMLAAERDTRDTPRLFVAYNDLLTDWRAVLDRVEQELKIDLLPHDTAAAAIEAFLTRELRHFETMAGGERPPIWPVCETVYAWLKSAAQGGPMTPEVMDNAARDLEALSATVDGALYNLRGDRNRLEANLAQARSDLDLGAQSLLKLTCEVEAVRNLNADLLLRLDHEAQTRLRLSEQEAKIADRTAQVEAAEERRRRAEDSAIQAERAFASIMREKNELEADRDRIGAELRAVMSGFRWRLTHPFQRPAFKLGP